MTTEFPVISADDPIEGPFKNVYITIAKPEHHAAILKQVKDFFCRDEPIIKSIGQSEKYKNAFVQYVKDGLTQKDNHQCLVALDQKTGEVAGCRVSKIQTKKIEEEDKLALYDGSKYDMPEEFPIVLRLLDELYEPISPNIFDKLNVPKIIDYKAVSVSDNYRQMGLGYELLLRSMRLAKKEGFQVIRGVFSSKYSRRPAEKLGMRLYNEIFYNQYKPNGEIVLKNMDPHPSIVLLIKILE